MAVIRFRGREEQRLWENVRNHLELIVEAPALRDMEGDKRRTAEVQMVAFMVTAAWG